MGKKSDEPETAQATPAIESPWAKEAAAVLAALDTTPEGLTSCEATKRLTIYGPNAFPEEPEEGILAVLWDAFNNPLSIVLSVAAILNSAIGLISGDPENLRQAAFIFGIVIAMALLGFFTERSSNKALDELKKMQMTIAHVRRDGCVVEINARDLVPGDIIVLESGLQVPADGRVITAERAEADESTLTGESIPVKKRNDVVLAADALLANRLNMVHGGTNCTGGVILAVVTATGLASAFGAIYDQVQKAEEAQTPLQQQLEVLGNRLLWATFIVCGSVLAVYIIRGTNLLEALISAVALAIAFIPEALGAVIMIALAMGVREMVAKQAIIKKPSAAEGLGSISVVCTDKTGTLTHGKMTASEAWTLGGGLHRVANGFNGDPDLNRLIAIAKACNNGIGATEQALASLAMLAGYEIASAYERLAEVPFNSARKMMSTVSRVAGRVVMQSKGAPERIIERCDRVLLNGRVVPLDGKIRQAIESVAESLQAEGKRVLAFADRDASSTNVDESAETDLVFVGLIALSDPARTEVRGTVETLIGAGITPVMITGDDKRTALAIAKEVGILPSEATLADVITGEELARLFANGIDGLSAADLERIAATRVFARTSPADKINLVRAYQKMGKLVAMAGDGVNDAPSLKQANVGIAMGQNATDVTKAVAQVVLTGSYAAIAAAVEVGRTILHRARLYCHALLSTNGAEVGIFIVAAFAGWPLVLTALQLLIINLLGDGPLSIALATEKAEPDVMHQKPRPASEGVITNFMYASIGLQSVVTTAIMAVAYLLTRDWLVANGVTGKEALAVSQSVLFVTFMIQKIIRTGFTARSLKYSIFQLGLFSNGMSLITVTLATLFVVVAVNIPFFGMVTPPAELLPSIFGLGLVPPTVEELVKFVRRHTTK